MVFNLTKNEYKNCITPDNCFVASSGATVNPLNPADMYSSAAQDASGPGDDPAYPRITRIGCNSCPFTTVATTTIPSPTCTTTPPNAAAIYIEDGVVLDNNNNFPKADPVGTCTNSTNGVITYYNGATPALWPDSVGNRVFVGKWIRETCTTPCVCTATACYTPQPGNPSADPFLFLYPQCITPDKCFIAFIFTSPGSIINPSNPADTCMLILHKILVLMM